MTDDEFELLSRILEDTTGLVHDDARRDSLELSVAGRVEVTRASSVAAYLGLLSGPNGVAERQQLIDVVTIQETHFFRNPPQIRALRQYVLPELIRRAAAEDRPLTIWSAGCSTGEEPYSVAMLVREVLPMASSAHVRVVGSDVSANALAAAHAGSYGPRAVQMAQPVDLARWFDRKGDTYVVRDDVRELVEFRLHNLVTEPPPFGPGEVDLLLCRNVTIYFNRATTKALMVRLHTALRDGGYLFLGHAETLWQVNDAFTLVPLGDAFVYRRDDPRDDEPSAADRRSVLPERRTEAGDPPVLLPERRGRSERRAETDASPGRSADRARGSAPRRPAAGSPPSHAGVRRPARVQAPERLVPDGLGVASAMYGTPAAGTAALPTAASGAAGHAEVARAALTAGRYADAVVAAARAARLDPLQVDPHLISGEALVNLGRDADAVKELRQAVYLQPNCAPAHLLLAGALDRLGEPAAAGRAYRAAAATVGDMPPAKAALLFGGRDAAELVQLCLRLAAQAERTAARKKTGR